MPGTAEDAKAISDTVLQATGRALMAGDAAEFLRWFALPSRIDTFDGQREIATEDGLRATYDSVRRHLLLQGATDLVRHVVSAGFADDRTIHFSYESRVLRGDALTQAPYAVFAILRDTGDGWKMTFSQYAIADSDRHNRTLLSAGSADRREGESA